jgi:hypothetical protein
MFAKKRVTKGTNMSNENYHTTSSRANKSQKVLRSSIYLAFIDSIKLKAQTLAVSHLGLTMMSPIQLAKGIICNVEFNIPLDGEIRKVKAISKTRDCVCVGTEGFRTRLSFIRIDPSSSRAINDLLQYPY